MKADVILLVTVGGVLVALMTGLLSNTPPMMVGATYYGYPFPWLTRLIIAPQYFPWRVDYVSLIGDILVWSVIVGLVLMILSRTRKQGR
jgi:hypothetical protein